MAGDVLRFLARGDDSRRFVESLIADHAARDPVYLLAHSLGGIMCVDLLVRGPIAGVRGLITVGSQAPFLYEIGALPALPHPEPLPDHFPPWTNVYDRRDVLSYVAAAIFGERVTDLCVDNANPFPQAHSSYWTNPEVWEAVRFATP
jgi:pimeloyl-ACP methyl ester carboxylesterase